MNWSDMRLAAVIESTKHLYLLFIVMFSALQVIGFPAPARACGEHTIASSREHCVFGVRPGSSVGCVSTCVGVFDDSSEVTGGLASRSIAEALHVMESGHMAASTNNDVSSDHGIVTVNTVSPDGHPVTAEIRLFRVVGQQNQLFAYSDNGTLEAKVSPGTYKAYAFKNGIFLSETAVFEVARYDHRQLVLEVSTIDIKSFVIVPQPGGSGDLSRLCVTYSLVNIEDKATGVMIRLLVVRNGELLETVSIVDVEPLTPGKLEGLFYYTPATRWRAGEYGFSLHVYANGQLRAETVEQTLKLGDGGGILKWLWILLVILGMLAAVAVGFLAFILLKKHRKEQRLTIAGKTQLEPEPALPTEPSPQIAETAMDEESMALRTRLSSVSTLKIRMATLGRDQGIVKDKDQDTDTEKDSEDSGSGKARK